MLFTYKAKKTTGEIYEGKVEVENKFELYDQVRSERATLVSYEEKKVGLSDKFEKVNNFLSRIKLTDKIIFARNLGAMIEAGLSLSRALSVMERQTKNKKFKMVLASLIDKINQGQTFASALEAHKDVFPPIFISMVKAGEESGGLSDSLKVVSSQLEKSYDLQRKIRGAMTYPTIIIGVMVLIGILMLMYVVPTLTATFKELGVELPLSTRIVIGVSDFLSSHIILSFAVLIASVGGFVWFLRTKVGKRALEWTILRIPVIKEMVKEANSARTARTLSSLLSAGVEVVHAISITKEVVQNSYYKSVLEEAEGAIQKGRPISEIFGEHEDIYPVLVGEMISVGEETGKLSDLLSQLASFYENEVEQKTKNLSTIIEPFLMVVIGAVVGFFAVSMITPMYSLVSGL
jgi:type IV pilus assembly protein PilC